MRLNFTVKTKKNIPKEQKNMIIVMYIVGLHLGVVGKYTPYDRIFSSKYRNPSKVARSKIRIKLDLKLERKKMDAGDNRMHSFVHFTGIRMTNFRNDEKIRTVLLQRGQCIDTSTSAFLYKSKVILRKLAKFRTWHLIYEEKAQR